MRKCAADAVAAYRSLAPSPQENARAKLHVATSLLHCMAPEVAPPGNPLERELSPVTEG